jgi:hypothetical protein
VDPIQEQKNRMAGQTRDEVAKMHSRLLRQSSCRGIQNFGIPSSGVFPLSKAKGTAEGREEAAAWAENMFGPFRNENSIYSITSMEMICVEYFVGSQGWKQWRVRVYCT